MGDLTLFIDPNDAGYPSTVRVLLDDFEKRKNICATVTPLGKCLLICDKEIYIWSCLSKETGIPNAIHMELPATGLNYSTNLVCLFNKAQYSKHLSLLAVSPEGSLRYWAELGRQMKNDQCLLNNEVAHSIQPVDTREQHHCFLLTTTTGSFHLIDLYHGLDQPDRLTTRPLDVGGPGGGFGRRMSLLIFGSFTAEKEPILKTLFVFNKMGPNVDVVNVLSKSLRFYSIGEQKTPNYEVDLADLVLSKFNKNSQRPEHRHFLIVDAVQHLAGILLLVVGDQQQHSTTKRLLVDRKLFLAYYEESTMRREVRTLTPIQLPDSLSLTGLDNRLKTATLLCPDQDECCIAFHDSFLLIRHPTNPSASSIHVLESYTTSRAQQSSPQHREIRSDSLLGAAVVHGACHLVLKEAAVCAVRRLPRHYDLNFWKKYRPILHQLDGLGGFCIPGTQQYRLKEAFVDFCAKNLKRAQNLLQEFADQNIHSSEPAVEDEHEEEPMDIAGRKSRAVAQNKEKQSENFAEMAVDLLFYFLDRQPSTPEDPRWTFTQETVISSDQRAQLKQLAETKKFNLVLRHLQVKQAFYKMFVLFLRTCNLIEWIDYPLQNYQLQSGKAMVVELGEKLVAMVATFRWLSEHSETLPLVNRAMSELSKQYQTRYGLPKGNPFLSPTDFVFNKVSTFHELVSAVVQAGEEALAEDSRGQVKARILREIGSLFLTLVEGVREAGREGWALHIEQGQSTWLSQPDFLTHFVTHLNAALDYLEAASLPPTSSPDSESAIILEQCKQLAHFVLSQQSADQRDDSKIICRFFALGHQEFALDLAEKYKDFTFLITFCHNKLDKHSCEQTLNRYKQQYEKDGFHDFLYTWYQQKGMFNHLLAERGKRASDFISQRHELNWIRQIEEGQYTKAKKTLKRMAGKEGDEHKKLIELSLCKMAALCEDQENVAEIAELSEQIQTLHEKRRQEEAAHLDGQSAADEQATNPFGIQMPPTFR